MASFMRVLQKVSEKACISSKYSNCISAIKRILVLTLLAGSAPGSKRAFALSGN